MSNTATTTITASASAGAAPKPIAPPKIKYIGGMEEVIKYPELDVFQRQEAINRLLEGRTPEVVMIVADRSREWMKSITEECYLELAEFACSQVFPMAVKRAKADLMMGLKLGPVSMEMHRVYGSMELLISSDSQLNGLLNGTGSSRTPAPADSAAPITPAA